MRAREIARAKRKLSGLQNYSVREISNQERIHKNIVMAFFVDWNYDCGLLL